MALAQQSVEVAATKVATAAQYGGGASAVFFGLTANEFAALGGLIIGAIGLLINIYYKHKHYKLAERHAPMQAAIESRKVFADE